MFFCPNAPQQQYGPFGGPQKRVGARGAENGSLSLGAKASRVSSVVGPVTIFSLSCL